ncbi:hypothetical protein CLAIMM_05191 [Cladophialophora immunda]|nr:hypothetical protein CLAIMM_05191 [Cladophialophora immunda]
MEPIEIHIEYIVDDPRFLTERPFAVNISPGLKVDRTLHTLDWVLKSTVIHDIQLLKDVSLAQYGFESFRYNFTSLPRRTSSHIQRLRNGPPINVGEVIDVNDPLHFDLPLRGAHNGMHRNRQPVSNGLTPDMIQI